MVVAILPKKTFLIFLLFTSLKEALITSKEKLISLSEEKKKKLIVRLVN